MIVGRKSKIFESNRKGKIGRVEELEDWTVWKRRAVNRERDRARARHSFKRSHVGSVSVKGREVRKRASVLSARNATGAAISPPGPLTLL